MIIWKDCKGYEGLYQVSNDGRVWSVRSQKYMSQQKTRHGYLAVHLTAKNGKHKMELVHRLVALVFLENPYHLPQVNHKNEIKTDNRPENLEWCDAKYNMNYSAHWDKIADTLSRPVSQIDKQTNKVIGEYSSITEAHKITGHSRTVIRRQCQGKTKSKQNYYFVYTEVN